MKVAVETNHGPKLPKVDLTDRLAHFAFTGIWAKDSRALRVSMSLSGIGQPGTNLMVNAYIPPEFLRTDLDGPVK